jgi:hypothetical protein
MFDDNNFARSKLYFGSLQLLRIFSDWIEESQSDFQQLFEDYVNLLTYGDRKDKREEEEKMKIDKAALISALEKTADNPKILFKAFLDRIKKKQNEIESLRDGVSIQFIQFSGYECQSITY